jgi:DNA polymerase-3 subunit epsilon
LSDKLKFKDIADEFVEFIGDSKIIIHNASFDLGFINTELEKCNIEKINEASIIDTLVLAKNKFRGQSVSLDSLCRKYNIDIRDREIHGALKDAKLLALVYLELIGGKQTTLKFNSENDIDKSFDNRYLVDINTFYNKRKILKKRNIKLDQDDYELHLQFMKEIRESIWEKIKY